MLVVSQQLCHDNVCGCQVLWKPRDVYVCHCISGCTALRHVLDVLQAKEALQSAYFDDLDKETVDALESDIIRAREG